MMAVRILVRWIAMRVPMNALILGLLMAAACSSEPVPAEQGDEPARGAYCFGPEGPVPDAGPVPPIGSYYVDQLPTGACSAGDVCQAQVRFRCPCPRNELATGAGFHQEQCECVAGAWRCRALNQGASICTPNDPAECSDASTDGGSDGAVDGT